MEPLSPSYVDNGYSLYLKRLAGHVKHAISPLVREAMPTLQTNVPIKRGKGCNRYSRQYEPVVRRDQDQLALHFFEVVLSRGLHPCFSEFDLGLLPYLNSKSCLIYYQNHGGSHHVS